MKSNPFNICPTCIHKNTCVLTAQKDQVWSCSEFEETVVMMQQSTTNISNENKRVPEMILA
ncbi:hypothetical protein IMCC3317_47080 [Kordia antarctica]|uniref:Uncharacterized protein n=1 Tax=Kordia antarctica TaxID=1218801 RepID=A0A7L4ZRH1_9FLAO|nr:hypothetical protein [Kordia antarctica]QHI39298.1 hypothetical protein IMCC3317_47080 [Kordia antarctica]